MRRLPLIAATLILIVVASPAFAVSCNGGTSPGFTLGLQFRFGDVTEHDEANFDAMRQRHNGVDVSSVEYWGGCIRAWVRNKDGRGEHMEFYDPRTLRRVDD